MAKSNAPQTNNTRQIPNAKYKKCIKWGIVFICIFIVIFLMHIFQCKLLDYLVFKYLESIKAGFIFLGLFLLGLGIIQCKNIKDKNSWLSNLPYQFDLEKEIYTHFIIGKKLKKLKIATKQYHNYTEWKNHITTAYKYLIDESTTDTNKKPDVKINNNNDLNDYRENFFRYLNSEYRFTVSYIEAIKTIMIPIEAGIIGVFCENRDLLSSLILNVVVMILMILETVKTESEQEFIKDFTEIVYEKRHLG